MTAVATTGPIGANIAILRGVIRREPDARVLPSGDEVLSIELSVRDVDRPADTVPVVWQNPPTSAFKLAEGDDVVVVGSQIRGAAVNAALPVTVLNEEQILATGAVNGDDLLPALHRDLSLTRRSRSILLMATN